MKITKIAFLSILNNILVVVLKLVAGILTNSVAILSEAIHSTLDLISSIIAYFSVRLSSKPADKNHPFGHDKIENISGTVETILILVAGIWIIYESLHKLFNPTPLKMPVLGVVVMLIGALLNFIVGRIVKKVGEKENSIAMRSNALHLLTDVYSSLGVAISLILIWLTGLSILDSIIGLCIAIYIIKEACKLGKESFEPLLDVSLSDEEEKMVENILLNFKHQYIEYHDLRTRRSGSVEHIDFHLVLNSKMDIGTAHNLCDNIETQIKHHFSKAQILIHIEPESEKHN